MMHEELHLASRWLLGEQIGKGGFGRVFAATSETGEDAVVKLIPKEPGAEREMLFADLENIRNIVPIVDSGETESDWALVMPRATCSLRDHLDASVGCLELPETLTILTHIATALSDLDGQVVHRDLKPENILLLGGRWCLADFGISRYAEASTAPDTHKFALTSAYAAPERWRSETATVAVDVYALGIVAYELLAGERPFPGPDFRQQHLTLAPPLLEGDTRLTALVEECLYKAPEARPRPANLLVRLEKIATAPSTGGLAMLQEANRLQVRQIGEAARDRSAAQVEAERRAALQAAASTAHWRIAEALRLAIADAAPATSFVAHHGNGWTARLGSANLQFNTVMQTGSQPWGRWPGPAFEVVAHSRISLQIPANRYEYEGRSHSLWYCDAQPGVAFQWFETAFMISALIPRRGRQNPFALDPSEEAAKALSNGLAEFQVAWPVEPLVAGELDEFIGRWAGWLAAASQGQLSHPSSMPERPIPRSWGDA